MNKPVPITHFSQYGDNNLLGKLEFPNGTCVTRSWDTINLFIEMADLYNLLIDWEINDNWENITHKIDVSDIIAIIAIGSAVKYPGYRTIETTHKKWWFFGPEIITKHKVKYQPNDVDFLIITHTRMINQKVLNPIWQSDNYNCCVKKGGIHIVNRSWDQFVAGVHDNCDSISTSAVKDGVLLFGCIDPFKYSKIELQSPLRAKWELRPGGMINGSINLPE